ncbi:hypothetical protein [Ferdinandcohnia sp. Marseille-Q9671]
MAKEYKNYRDMKSIKGIMKNKSDKINQEIEHLNQKMGKLIEHVQKK